MADSGHLRGGKKKQLWGEEFVDGQMCTTLVGMQTTALMGGAC